MDLQPRVLVVSSSNDHRSIFTEVLKDWELTAICGETASDAKTLLRQPGVLLVFCEDNLSDGSYRDILEVTSQKRPPLRLVVLLHDQDQYNETLSSGAFDALPVPLNRSDVQWMVIHALRGKDESFPTEMFRQLRRRAAPAVPAIPRSDGER